MPIRFDPKLPLPAMMYGHLLRRMLCCLALLPLVTSAFAGSPFRVIPITYEGKMPFVEATDGSAQKVATRINHAVFFDLLELPAPARPADGLKANKRDVGLKPISDISFVVDRLDPRLLALSVSAEGCGAYCELFTRGFVFDAVSGYQVRPDDIFSPGGSRAIASILARQRGLRIKAEVTRLQALANPASRSGKALTEEERNSNREAAEMFEACLPTYTENVRDEAPLGREELRIVGAAVVFVQGRCSIHAMRALDELGDFINPIPVKDLTPHLNAYGKYLLAQGPVTPSPASPFGQVLFGKVGAVPITMWLRMPYGPEQNLSGLYFYDRFRIPISLFGSNQSGNWELEEETAEGKTAPVLRFKVTGASLKGEWVGPSRRLALDAAP